MENIVNKLENLAQQETVRLDREEGQAMKRAEAKEVEGMMLELRDMKEKEKLVQYKKEKAERDVAEDIKMIHSRPISMKEFIENRTSEIKRTIEERVTTSEAEGDTNISPSIFHLINGETFLAKHLGLTTDSDKSFFINDFVLSRMDIEGLEDSSENFDKILNDSLDKIGITKDHKKEYILNKLYYYLSGKNTFKEDDLVLSIMKNKSRNRAFQQN